LAQDKSKTALNKNDPSSHNATSKQQPSLLEDKKSCFGFEDDATDDDDADVSQASSIGGGCMTLSEFSPVKRSSMLPPSHFITLLASPSSSSLSVTNDFAKPLSSRYENVEYDIYLK
jgi:hypothetical protein